MEDTPAFRAGITAWRQTEIDGESTEALRRRMPLNGNAGEPGTKVKLKILRVNPQEIKEVEIIRAVIKVDSVKDARMLEDGIAKCAHHPVQRTNRRRLAGRRGIPAQTAIARAGADLRNNWADR